MSPTTKRTGKPWSTHYIVICQSAVGNPESGYGVTYASDMREFTYRDDAIRHGFALGRSDDFNVGKIENGRLDGFYWMSGRLDADLAEIARHLAIDGPLPARAGAADATERTP